MRVDRGRAGQAEMIADLPIAGRIAGAIHKFIDEVKDFPLPFG